VVRRTFEVRRSGNAMSLPACGQLMLAFANCHQLHEQGRTIPSFFMRKWSVDLFNPSLVAAPCGPESTHLVSCKIERICSRSTCARVWGFMFPCPGAIRERM